MENKNIFEVDWAVYVAGVKVPANDVSITTAFNAIPTATIALPSYYKLFGIGRKDRVPVHIFYKDHVSKNYILLFEGEITGFSYSSSIVSRDITVNAQGIMGFLQDIQFNFLTTLDELAVAGTDGFNDVSIQNFTPNIVFPMSLFMYGLGEVREDNLVKFPYDYLDNMVQFIANANSMNQFNNSALAEFYSKYCKMLKVPNRYVRIPYFDEESDVWAGVGPDQARVFPLISGMQINAAMSHLQHLANEGVNQGTALQFINYLVNQMEYEFSFFNSPIMSGGNLVTFVLKPMFYDALPPKCNIIYRSQVRNLMAMEKTYNVATRIRTRDINGVFAKLAQGVTSGITEYGLVDYYPTNKYKDNTVNPNSEKPLENFLATELLDSEPYDWEKFTGPWVYETAAPTWMSYLGPEAIGGNLQIFKERLLARLLHHKQHEARTLQVLSVFNPYVVPGLPGAVFDAYDVDFAFSGHVLVVNHTLSKSEVSTTIEMGFVRLLSEDLENPMVNPIPSMEAITKDKTKMSDIYNAIIGCDAMTWEEVNDAWNAEAQYNPMKAYEEQYRPIVGLDEYFSFMGVSASSENEVLSGEYVDNRRDENLRNTLQEIKLDVVYVKES